MGPEFFSSLTFIIHHKLMAHRMWSYLGRKRSPFIETLSEEEINYIDDNATGSMKEIANFIIDETLTDG